MTEAAVEAAKRGVDVLSPQPGPQSEFLASPADIVIYGGAAYGGKSYGLLLDAARYSHLPNYNGIIFRRTSPQITSGGGLWDTSSQIYSKLGATPIGHFLKWEFPADSFIKFSHMQHEKTKLDHQGAQYVFIGFDELTHFTEGQFFYLMSRNRPPAGFKGAKPYMRATTNPDADSWVRDLIDWWIDDETGLPIQERSGVLRYFTRINDEIVWVEESWKDSEGNGPKSLTFIPSTIDDNPLGKIADPFYKSTLMAMAAVDRERLLNGNWNISYKGGMLNPLWFKIIEENEVPGGIRWIRYWDKAGTEPEKEDDDPDYTAGAKCGLDGPDLYIRHMERFRLTPAKTEAKVKQNAAMDGHDTPIGIEQEPGSAGIESVDHYRALLHGYEFHADRPTGSKIDRAKTWAAKAEQGHVYIVRGKWNRAFLAEAGSFPLNKRDQIDAVSGAYKLLVGQKSVWPQYSGELFKDFDLDWTEVEPDMFNFYSVVIQQKDTGIHGNWFFWGKRSRKLFVVSEFGSDRPVPEIIIGQIRAAAGKGFSKTTKILGNSEMFSKGENTIKLMRKRRMRIREAKQYDINAAIMFARELFVENRVVVHTDCIATDLQYRGWEYDGRIPADGYPHCIALAIVVNELRGAGEFDSPTPLPPYSQRKVKVREKMRGGRMNVAPRRSEWEYMAK